LQEKGQVGYEAIVKKYGSKVLANNEELDRGKLREIAFKNKADKKWLEELMHPLIREKIIEGFSNINSKWAIYSAPLWGPKNKFNRVLVIDAPEHLQIERIANRDKSTKKIAETIIKTQMNRNERISYSNDLLINDGSVEDFERKLDFYFQIYEKLANEEKN
jgi:dephospho-CoA kinase